MFGFRRDSVTSMSSLRPECDPMGSREWDTAAV